MARIQPMSAISPKQIAEAEQRAKDDYLRAYGPMPVSQPDGTHIQLCWYGRIDRAFIALESAKGTDKEPLIKRALSALIEQSRAAQQQAHESASVYEHLCAESGLTASDVVPKKCSCDYCANPAVLHGVHFARVEMASQLADLIIGKAGQLPLLVDLVSNYSAGDKDALERLTGRLRGVTDAMRKYHGICDKVNVQPDWRIY